MSIGRGSTSGETGLDTPLKGTQSNHPPYLTPPQALLLCTPAYAREASLPIYLPGELLGQTLTFAAQPVVLWASPANPGAKALADELADICPSGLTVTSSAEAPESATHMLLYLNLDTWSDERLAEQVKQAREDELPLPPTRPHCYGRLFGRGAAWQQRRL